MFSYIYKIGTMHDLGSIVCLSNLHSLLVLRLLLVLQFCSLFLVCFELKRLSSSLVTASASHQILMVCFTLRCLEFMGIELYKVSQEPQLPRKHPHTELQKLVMTCIGHGALLFIARKVLFQTCECVSYLSLYWSSLNF